MRTDGTTETAQEAIDLLQRYRQQVLRLARHIAHDLARQQGQFTVRDIRAEMIRREQFPSTLDERWMGAIFATREFRQTGAYEIVRFEPGSRHHDGGRWPYWTAKEAQ